MRGRFVRFMAWGLIFIMISQLIVFNLSYQAARHYLQENDPRRLQNRSEMFVYFAPPVLKRGAGISSEKIIRHLSEIAYAEREGDDEATFSLTGNRLKINSRLRKIFPDLMITFERGRVKEILVDNQGVESAQIEPLPMQNFIKFINDASPEKPLTRRIVLQAGNVPEIISDSVTTAEDKRFFETNQYYAHHGFDVFATFNRVLTGKGGGSTLTQQILKNNVFYGAQDELWQSYLGFLPVRYQRKILEPTMALAAESLYSKDELLAAYLSMVPYGSVENIRLQGIVAAAQTFFGKSPANLNLSEAACLAGMIHRPSKYLKYVRQNNTCQEGDEDCKDLRLRRNTVLDGMLVNYPERYNRQMIDEAKTAPLNFVFLNKRKEEQLADTFSKNFVIFAANNLPKNLEKLKTDEGVLRFFTTLDADLQRDGYEIVETELNRLQPKVEKACRDQHIICEETTRDGKTAKLKPQAALVAIDGKTGEILTMVGGIGSEFNYATDARRSFGSAGKPFYYEQALEKGLLQGEPFTAATIIDPAKDTLSEYCAENNLGKRSTARDALARSYNFGACLANQSAGVPIDFVGGLTNSKPERKLMSAIGGTAGSEVTLIDFVSAASIFTNNGKFVKAVPFKLAYQEEKLVNLEFSESVQKADPGATFIVTQMMRSVLENGGTGANFYQLAGLSRQKVIIAGKSGSGQRADLWFFVVLPSGLIVGSWVGMPNNKPDLRMDAGFSGGAIVAPIIAKFMKNVAKHRPELLDGNFVKPDNVKILPINAERGCVTPNGSVKEYFINGREPAYCK